MRMLRAASWRVATAVAVLGNVAGWISTFFLLLAFSATSAVHAVNNINDGAYEAHTRYDLPLHPCSYAVKLPSLLSLLWTEHQAQVKAVAAYAAFMVTVSMARRLKMPATIGFFWFHFRLGLFPFLCGTSHASFCDSCPVVHSHFSLQMACPHEFPTTVLLDIVAGCPACCAVGQVLQCHAATHVVEPAGQQ
jgi:hypothetical protein